MFQRDEQIAGRFPTIKVAPWGLTEEYAQLVHDVFLAMGLGIPSPAEDYDIVDELHQRPKGLTGVTKKIVTNIACQVLQTGGEEVDRDLPKPTRVAS